MSNCKGIDPCSSKGGVCFCALDSKTQDQIRELAILSHKKAHLSPKDFRFKDSRMYSSEDEERLSFLLKELNKKGFCAEDIIYLVDDDPKVKDGYTEIYELSMDFVDALHLEG